MFNADAVKNIRTDQGRHAGELRRSVSSVLDITMNDGNDKGFHGSGGIGLISSRLTLEGLTEGPQLLHRERPPHLHIDVLTKPFINEAQLLRHGLLLRPERQAELPPEATRTAST